MRCLILLSLVIILLSTGCVPTPLASDLDQTASSDLTPLAAENSTPQPAMPQESQVVPSSLIIWVPDDFPIRSAEQAAKMLMDRIESFEVTHPDIQVDLRYKNIKQQENMLDLLSSTDRAAPLLLPDVILINQHDLETAALKGLVRPLDELPSSFPIASSFPGFASPAILEGSRFGLPVAGDALLLISNKKHPGESDSWQSILDSRAKVSINLSDPNGLFYTALYLSSGGSFVDVNGRPYLDPAALTTMIQFLREAGSAGTLPDWNIPAASWEQIADNYSAGAMDYQVNWFSVGTVNDAYQLSIANIPGLGKIPATALTGWYWASANPVIEKQSARIELIAFLAQPAFSSPWSATAGYLPAYDQDWPAGLAAIPDLPGILKTASPLPTMATIITIGPVLRDACLRALTTDDPVDEIVTAATARINQ